MRIREETAPASACTANHNPYIEHAVTVPQSGDPALVLVPQTGEPVALALYLHGRTGSELSIHDRPTLRDGLLDAGYLVASPNLHGDQWGNRTAQDDIGALEAWVTGRWPVTRRFVIGESMGGNAAANAVWLGEVGWDCAVFIAPSLSMRAVWGRGEHGRESLIVAYDLSADGHDLDGKTEGWDAIRHRPEGYAGIRALVYASSDDEIANLAGVTVPWVDKLRSVSDHVRLIEVTGEHVSEDHFRPREIVEFFEAAIRT